MQGARQVVRVHVAGVPRVEAHLSRAARPAGSALEDTGKRAMRFARAAAHRLSGGASWSASVSSFSLPVSSPMTMRAPLSPLARSRADIAGGRSGLPDEISPLTPMRADGSANGIPVPRRGGGRGEARMWGWPPLVRMSGRSKPNQPARRATAVRPPSQRPGAPERALSTATSRHTPTCLSPLRPRSCEKSMRASPQGSDRGERGGDSGQACT